MVHLTGGATEIARMVLDGASPQAVTGLLATRHPETDQAAIAADVGTIAGVVESLQRPTDGCPTCALEVERTDIFSQRATAPYKADLALTYECNNRCAHCYNEVARVGQASRLSAVGTGETPVHRTSHWREVLRRLAAIGVPHIIFTGGEPTLHEGLVDLVAHAERLGLVTGLNTNGRRLSEPGLAPRLARAGLDHVQITLASHRPEVHNEAVGADAFDETVQGIQSALAAGLHAITNTTLTRANRDHILQVVDFVAGLGVTTFAMNGMICAGGGRCNDATLREAELVPILEAVRDRARDLAMRFLWYTPTQYCRLSPVALGLGPKACNAAEYSICIEPDGGVLPCQSYYQPAGNILRDDWPAIWDSALFRRLRERREQPRAAGLPEKCWTCDSLTTCGGGCMLGLKCVEG